MARRMITKVSDYIVSPLGMGTAANYAGVKAGESRLRRYEGLWNLPEPFVASLMDNDLLTAACREAGINPSLYTRFEQMCLLSAVHALQGTGIRTDVPEVLFIIASTKGNVELLDQSNPSPFPPERVLLTEAARQITAFFRNPNPPLVVCNACISGLHAQLMALRLLQSQQYDYAVVIGADVISPFIVSGFQALKALSGKACRPFDEERTGLNLGEAAGCMVYGRKKGATGWHAVTGKVCNDAFHLSSPSRTAEGAYRALKATLEGQDTGSLACINVHGTATLFNDEMESVAIDRMGLNACPLFGLKGYLGHTMGAAGVVETILSMAALDDHCIPATRGFAQSGVSRQVNVSDQPKTTDKTTFVKMMAGFGGCNAAMLFTREPVREKDTLPTGKAVHITHTVRLTHRGVEVDGKTLPTEGQGMDLLKTLYQTQVGNYPKFYKMDPLCKLGFLGSELLLNAEAQAEGKPRFTECEDRAVILTGRSASICADRAYQQTLEPENYFPSPAAFIYTLPNILTGEIAIRNRYHGETAFLLQDNPSQTESLMKQALDAGAHSVLGGWIEMENTACFEAKLYIINSI